jgi:hypothetical protein
MAFPPRLKVVAGDGQAAEQSAGVNPIGGEVVFQEDEGDTDETADDTAYGSPPDAEPEPVPPMRRDPLPA